MEKLEFDNIPKGVLDDIIRHHKSILVPNYGKDLTKEELSSIGITTKLSNHRKVIAENVECTAFDQKIFKIKNIIGTIEEHYVVQGIFDDTFCDLYAVFCYRLGRQNEQQN